MLNMNITPVNIKGKSRGILMKCDLVIHTNRHLSIHLRKVIRQNRTSCILPSLIALNTFGTSTFLRKSSLVSGMSKSDLFLASLYVMSSMIWDRADTDSASDHWFTSR